MERVEITPTDFAPRLHVDIMDAQIAENHITGSATPASPTAEQYNIDAGPVFNSHPQNWSD